MGLLSKLFKRKIQIVQLNDGFYIRRGDKYLDAMGDRENRHHSWYNRWWSSERKGYAKMDTLAEAEERWDQYNNLDKSEVVRELT